MFDTSIDLLAVADLEGRVHRVNPAWERLLGWSDGQVVGRSVLDLVHPDERTPTEQALLALAEGVDEMRFELRLRSSTDTYCSFLGTAQVDRETGLVLALAKDITERREVEEDLREAEERFRQAFEHAPVGMALTTFDGDFLRVNRALCSMTGYTETQLIGMEQRLIAVAEEEDAFAAAARHVLASGADASAFIEQRLRHADGHLVSVDTSISLVTDADGRPLYFVMQLADVTERKRAEAALADANEELARRNEELERSNDQLERFAYVASHDLKSPLQVVRGFLDLLVRTRADQLDEQGREFVQAAVRGAHRMEALIDDLLSYASVGRGAGPRVSVSLGELLDEVREDLEARLAETGGQVVSDSLPTVVGDRTQLRQLLQNLVSNAVKFHRPDEEPRVLVDARADEAGWQISVEDNGIGIPPDQREHVFNMFTRIHGGDAYPGTGIGLAICHRVVENHGGRIWVDDAPGGGTRITFTLPT